MATTEAVQLNRAAGVEVDAAEYLACLAAADTHAAVHRAWKLCTPCSQKLAQAAALYRGDFLTQFYLSDSAPFEEWALAARLLAAADRLRREAQARLTPYEQQQHHAWVLACRATLGAAFDEAWAAGQALSLAAAVALAASPPHS